MPLVTVTLHQGRTPEFKSQLLDAVHGAIVSVGVPAADRFQRVIELAPGNFRFDPHYPNVERPRGQDFVLIEILWSVGRSVKIKRQMLSDLMQRLTALGLDTEHVMVSLQETQWENWAFAGGRQIHA